MSDRHVVPVEDGWQVEKDHAQRASAKTATQAEAITRAAEIVANDGGGHVIIHGLDGRVRETRAVEHATSDVSAGVHAARDGDRHPAGAARAVTADAASIVQDAGDEVAGQIDDTARQVSGEVRAVGARGASALSDRATDTAERAGQVLRRETDRAASLGSRVDDELDTAARRAARRVHTVTERAARPLDATIERLTHAVDPPRITGRAVELGVSALLRSTGSLTFRGTRAARQTARTLTRDR
jgi:hypothetical protein